jgi:hypothetical protein
MPRTSWQPLAALANKAFTVYDVAKGRASPLALLTMGKGVPAGGGCCGIGSLFGGRNRICNSRVLAVLVCLAV